MPPRKGSRPPKLCYHKTAKRYYVTLDDKEFYLHDGKRDKARSTPRDIQDAYDQLIMQWLARRQSQPVPVGTDPTIDELWLGYRAYLDGPNVYVKHGRKTTEPQTISQACRIVARLHGETLARLFTPPMLTQVKEEFIKEHWARGHINKQLKRARGMFGWGVAQGLVPETIHRALMQVKGVRKTEARARGIQLERKIKPVSWELVEATLPELPEPLPDLVRVHRLIGCRAQDVVIIRPQDIDQAAAPGLWRWTPAIETGPTSKTEHHEGEDEPLAYWLGLNAQALLRPLLDGLEPGAWVFSTTGKKGNGRRRGRYTTQSYTRAVARACDRTAAAAAKAAERDKATTEEKRAARWSPLQVRHTRLSEIRAKFGAEAAQTVARHKQLSTTEIYAEKSAELAQRVMREIG